MGFPDPIFNEFSGRIQYTVHYHVANASPKAYMWKGTVLTNFGHAGQELVDKPMKRPRR